MKMSVYLFKELCGTKDHQTIVKGFFKVITLKLIIPENLDVLTMVLAFSFLTPRSSIFQLLGNLMGAMLADYLDNLFIGSIVFLAPKIKGLELRTQ